jgi:fructose-1,6-bisphosphatase/inositol monophosphatase family enzyme
MDSLMPAVEDLLRHVAEQEVMSRFGKLGEGDIRHKARQGDLVTVADLEAENRISAGLKKLLPDSVVVGEEGCHKSPDILEALSGKPPVWVVDPVDGTHNFAHGKPCFAVMCALIEGGETQMGWILDPISGACATAQLGHGAFVSGQKMTITNPGRLESLRGSVSERIQTRLKSRRQDGENGLPEHFVRYRCVGREYIDLALGKINFALYGGQMMPWDHAAGTLLVTEAGGFARTIGSKTPYDTINHGHGERLLIAPDEATFDALSPLLVH